MTARPISPICPISPIRGPGKTLVPPLKPLHVHFALPPMTMNDRIDRRRPVPGRDIVPEERELEAAATEQPPRLKGRGKGKTTT